MANKNTSVSLGDHSTGNPSHSADGVHNSGSLRILRASSQADFAAFRDIAREFHAESRYAHLPFSEQKLAGVFARAVSNPADMLALFVQVNGETVGVLNAGVGEYYLARDGRLATVYVLYVSGRVRTSLLGGKIGLQLLRTAAEWAKSQKAQELHIHATSGIAPERTDKLLRRLGFLTYGGNYAAVF